MTSLFSGFKKNSQAITMLDSLNIALDAAIVNKNFNSEQFDNNPALKSLAEKIITFSNTVHSDVEADVDAKLSKMQDICTRASRGDLEARLLDIDPGGRFAPLENSINRMIDVSDAFSRDVGASLDYVSDGKYFRRIMEDGLEGVYVRYARNVNTAVSLMGKKTIDFRAMTNQFAENIRAVAADATEMSAPVDQLAGTAILTSKECSEASDAAEVALQHVQAVASAADEMVASIEEVDRQINSSHNLVSEVASNAANTNETIGELSAAASKIEEVMHLIQDIAEKTNLLALNATIEAARAGDAGRGFAVVASEVKGLAGQTAKATSEIGQQIAGVQRTVGETVAAIQGISKKIENISEVSSIVTTTITEQNSVIAEISRSAHGAAEGTQGVAQSIASVNNGAQSTGAAAEQLKMTTKGLSDRSQSLIAEVNEFLKSI